MGLKGFFCRLLRDERGQSTTEYILILSVVVMIAMKFRDKFGNAMGDMTNKVTDGIVNQIETNVGGGGGGN